MSNKLSELEKFYPDRAYRIKLYLYTFSMYILATTVIIIISIFFIFLISIDNEIFTTLNSVLISLIEQYGGTLLLLYLLLSAVCIIFGFLISIYYIKTLEFRIEENEVIIKKGIINKTVKHIPFRNITNVSSRVGIYDKILGIGNVEIETAGTSGQKIGPKGKIEGIQNFIEIRTLILNSIRKFTIPYTTTTELELPLNSVDSDLEFYKELILILNEIKNILI